MAKRINYLLACATLPTASDSRVSRMTDYLPRPAQQVAPRLRFVLAAWVVIVNGNMERIMKFFIVGVLLFIIGVLVLNVCSGGVEVAAANELMAGQPRGIVPPGPPATAEV